MRLNGRPRNFFSGLSEMGRCFSFTRDRFGEIGGEEMGVERLGGLGIRVGRIDVG